MKPKIWLRTAKRSWEEIATDDKGTLDISRIAKRTDLRPETLLFCELAACEGITIEEVRDSCGSTAGQTKDIAVLVDGDAMPAAHIEELIENSGVWINSMLQPQPIKLPQNPCELTAALFPKDHGKLPVCKITYLRLRQELPPQAWDFIVEANDSELPASLAAAEDDILRMMRPLSLTFYGEVQFILGYIAAGTDFQWVYIDKDGKTAVRIKPCLNVTSLYDRLRLLLSLGNAYEIMKKMVESIPEVPGRRAMFSEEECGDRTIYFQPSSVRKAIRNFPSYCVKKRTTFELIRQAYKVAQGVPSLPEVISEPEMDRRRTYNIEIGPLGYSPTLRSENDMKLLARDVLKALSVLHAENLVHRDIRLPNIVQVSAEGFMLIDLETVAESPFQLPEGFQPFADWSKAMLEDGHYTPQSDLYQLGVLLQSRHCGTAQRFISSLKSKQWTAEEALKDAWLSPVHII